MSGFGEFVMYGFMMTFSLSLLAVCYVLLASPNPFLIAILPHTSVSPWAGSPCHPLSTLPVCATLKPHHTHTHTHTHTYLHTRTHPSTQSRAHTLPPNHRPTPTPTHTRTLTHTHTHTRAHT